MQGVGHSWREVPESAQAGWSALVCLPEPALSSGHRRRARLGLPTTIVTGDLHFLHDVGGIFGFLP
jgi:hypothetical protein